MKKQLVWGLCTSVVAFFSCATNTAPREIDRTHKKFESAIVQNKKVIHFADSDFIAVESLDQAITRAPQKKDWTFIVYVAADNDLRAFAGNNIKQMASIGSNAHLNIVVHLDIRFTNNQKTTRRYYVEKDKITQKNIDDPATQRMDSGDPATLISCCEWAITNYPADNYALIFWNHGTGIIDPKHYKIINPAELFTFNPRTNKFDLDRSIGFLDLLDYYDQDDRGICWDNTTGNFLTNKKLNQALTEIRSRYLNNKKFSLIGFDACLMSMLEVANIIRRHSEIMVSSQEVELGTGWNYAHVLQALTRPGVTKEEFAGQIVAAFHRTYDHLTNDYTQSAINLSRMPALEKNVNDVANLLIECLSNQRNGTVKKTLSDCRNRRQCTHFDEPSYIDLHHFYDNVLKNLNKFSLQGNRGILNSLRQKLSEGKEIIQNAVFSNTVGKNLKNAQGLSIYFPENRIHPSYPYCLFSQENAWYTFLTHFMTKRHKEDF